MGAKLSYNSTIGTGTVVAVEVEVVVIEQYNSGQCGRNTLEKIELLVYCIYKSNLEAEVEQFYSALWF